MCLLAQLVQPAQLLPEHGIFTQGLYNASCAPASVGDVQDELLEVRSAGEAKQVLPRLPGVCLKLLYVREHCLAPGEYAACLHQAVLGQPVQFAPYDAYDFICKVSDAETAGACRLGGWAGMAGHRLLPASGHQLGPLHRGFVLGVLLFCSVGAAFRLAMRDLRRGRGMQAGVAKWSCALAHADGMGLLAHSPIP